MDTNLLHIFIDVVNSGSFANAAKKRLVDPSSISRSVAMLENHLGACLFHRTTRKITLTEAGEIYLKRIEPICDELARAKEDINLAQQQLKGCIRFSTSVAFGQTCIIPLMSEFKKLYPDLEVDIRLDDRNLDLIDEQLDFAIRLNKTADNRFIRSRVRTSNYRVCATPDYVTHHPSIEIPDDITKHQLIVFNLPNYKSKWGFKNDRGDIKDVAVKGKMTMSNALAIRDCTLQGLGVSLMADWLVDEDIASGKLIHLMPEYQVSADNFDTAIWIVYPERAFLPTKTRVTIDFIKERLLA
ncbi:LysR family transcriptional regulator [Alteromonadaceae bacterium M269]|nr:LysR family transcriptional regulator [Alteromonadaceae bacterium M269]